jgi:hypothetical protein
MPTPPPTKPITLGVNLTAKARQLVETLRADTGVPSTTATERFLEWLMGMPPKFRLAILNRDAAAQDELLIDWLREHLATKGLKITPMEPDDVTSRVRLITKLLNEIHATYEGTRDAALVAKSKRKG